MFAQSLTEATSGHASNQAGRRRVVNMFYVTAVSREGYAIEILASHDVCPN